MKIPTKPAHPGLVILRDLESRKISQTNLAKMMGIKQSYLNTIINGQRGINARFAYLLSYALDSDPVYWLDLQRDYDLELLEKDSNFQDRLKKVRHAKWDIR